MQKGDATALQRGGPKGLLVEARGGGTCTDSQPVQPRQKPRPSALQRHGERRQRSQPLKQEGAR